MAEIFNYSTFNTNLNKQNRSMTITLKSSEAFGMERLFELESVFSWLTNKVEITTVYLTSESSCFTNDWTCSERLNENFLKKVVAKVRKLNQAMLHLPQTFIVDLGQKANGLGLELAIGADLRIAQKGCSVQFNHLQQGTLPASGTLSILNQLIGPAQTKNWVLSSSLINESKLINSGFVLDTYDETNKDEFVKSLLFNISSQSQVQRIQAKMGLNEPLRMNNETMSDFESSIFNASLVTEDWKVNIDAKEQSMPAKHFGQVVKMSSRKKNTAIKPNKNQQLAEVKPFRRPERSDH